MDEKRFLKETTIRSMIFRENLRIFLLNLNELLETLETF